MYLTFLERIFLNKQLCKSLKSCKTIFYSSYCLKYQFAFFAPVSSSDETSKNERILSPVKVVVSPNHFSMTGPWLEHVLDFHFVKNAGSPLLGTAERFEFQSRTPIADAIKLASAYSNKTEIDNFLHTRSSRRVKKGKHASVQVDFENRPPMPVPKRRNITANKMDKPPIGKPKLKLPNKGSANVV